MNPQSIPLGTQAEAVQIVTQDDLASILGEVDDIFPKVFATSKMAALMEIASSRVLKKFLLSGECSVGIEININHVSPTSIGAKVRAQATLIDFVDNVFTFTVQASDESGLISEGTHKRSIVNIERLEKGALRKINL
jgi:fluoroacetyl-CoA thioesterase